ncbi:hypothetical protein BC629DRAFT_277497 [Irpex lacteus]|nr:hypothetical protein BC629DRAFT_277497 [Irpex lacteus]
MSDFQSSSSQSSPSSSPSPILGTPHLDEAPLSSFEKDFFSNFSCCGLTLADMHELLDHFEESHVLVLGTDGKPVYPHFAANTSASPSNAPPLASMAIGYPQPHPPAEPSAYTYTPPKQEYYGYAYNGPDAGVGLGYPDLEEPYNPFGFDDYHGFAGAQAPLSSSATPPPYEQPPLLRINTSFPRSSISSTSTDSDVFSTSTPSPTFTATTSSGPPYSSAPSPLSVSSLPRSTASSTFSSPDLKPSRAADERCFPPALLSLPPQISQHQRIQMTTSLPLIESKPLGPHISKRTTAIEPYNIPPSLSRRNSSFIAQQHPSYSHSHSYPASSPQPTVGPHRTVPTSLSHSLTVQTGRPPAMATGRPPATITGRPPATITGRPPATATGRSRRRDGREKAFKCPHPGCTKSYLNPNGLKYHLEKGTCVVDPTFVDPTTSLPSLSVASVATESLGAPVVVVQDKETEGRGGEEKETEDEGREEERDRWSSPIALPCVPPVPSSVPISPITLV